MKFHYVFSKNDVALPLRLAFTFPEEGGWMAGLQLLFFMFILYGTPKPAAKPIEYQDEGNMPVADHKATKAYVDQRQKAKRNRRRKPKKALAHTYRLG